MDAVESRSHVSDSETSLSDNEDTDQARDRVTRARCIGERKRCIVCSKKKSPQGKLKDAKPIPTVKKCNVYVCSGQCFKHFTQC